MVLGDEKGYLMSGKGPQVPDHQQNGAKGKIEPPPLPVQLLAIDAKGKNAHACGQEEVRQLMDVEAFVGAMGLNGERRLTGAKDQEKNTKCYRKKDSHEFKINEIHSMG